MAGVDIKGLPQFTRALDRIQKNFPDTTRDAAHQVARDAVAGARSFARTAQARLAASSLTAGTNGQAGTVTSNAALFAGAEFGGQGRPSTMQFPPHRGKRGYFLYPWMRQNAERLNDRWDKAVYEAMEPWDYRPR